MSKNPFDDDYRSSSITGSGNLKSYTTPSNIEDEADYYEREMEKYMQETVDSTERSKAHLANSERIGTQTAQDLLEQREKLERANANLDQIYHTTQVTQRNLNSLKSVVGGYFKNKFSRKPQEKELQVPAAVPVSKSASNLSKTMDEMKTGGSSASFSGPSYSGGSGATLSESSRNAIKGTRWEAMDNQIDENLDTMAANLRNLKGLGEALGKEVDDQNKLLDKMYTQSTVNNDIIRKQDKQMNVLLGKAEAKEANSSTMPSVDASTKMSLAMKAASWFK